MDANKIESNNIALSCQHTLNPTPIVTSNRYALLRDETNDDTTVLHSNTSTPHVNQPPKQPKQNVATHTNYTTTHLKIAKNMAVADAGATGHFVLPGTPVTDVLAPSTPTRSDSSPQSEVLVSRATPLFCCKICGIHRHRM